MATYDFSTLIAAGNKTLAFLSTDILTFNDAIPAADLIITTTSNGIILKLNGGNELTLTGFIQIQISSLNFIFADGSRLLIGDTTTSTISDDLPNQILDTDFNDYVDGRSGNDTISYKNASSGVTVNLITNKTDGGAGIDTLISVESIIGSNFNDVLTGLATGASAIDGGGGIDMMTGGTANDTYTVTSGDMISDGGGTDTVISALDYALAAGLENLTLLVGAANGFGNASANTLTGNSGNNFLDGSGGADNMKGGLLNDTYVVDNTSDVVEEASNAGIDLIQSSVSVTGLVLNVENLLLSGSSNINGTGNTVDNILYANKGDNVLNGSTNGAVGDTVSYLYGAKKGVTVSLGIVGTPQVTIGSGSDTLSNFENLTGSSYGDKLTGDAKDNVITGGLGNDTLDGGVSLIKDTLIGGKGDDIYVVDTTNIDTITEIAGEGIDTIKSSVDYSIHIHSLANIENLTLTGSGARTATGNAQNNVLRGESSGNDTLVGELGNDSYYINGLSDTITELAGQGTDTVFAGFTYTIPDADVENITMTTAGTVGTGTTITNILTASNGGNTLKGLAGDDKLFGGDGADNLDGGTGNDTMTGGKGNDTYTLDSLTDVVFEKLNEGTDAVLTSINNYTLAADVENLTLTDAGNINGNGNILVNKLTGNNGNNKLDGNIGNDTLIGGLGDDTYVVDSNADIVTESSGQGTDWVMSTASNYTLAANVENLTLIGTNAINGVGNGQDNVLTGNDKNNTLSGGAGNDTFNNVALAGNANGGVDTLKGNAGNDTYLVDSNTDIVTEVANEGVDLVQSLVTFSLNDSNSVGVENLTLTGTFLINGSGNSLANAIVGNTKANMLDGNAGKDTLTGGGGKDIFIFSAVNELSSVSSNTDVITDYNKTTDADVIDLSVIFNGVAPNLLTVRNTAFANDDSAQVNYATVGSNTVISGDTDGNGAADFTILLTGNLTTAFTLSDFDFTL